MTPRPRSTAPSPDNPSVLFFALVLFNGLLSYAPLPLPWKLWVGIVGGSAFLLHLARTPWGAQKGTHLSKDPWIPGPWAAGMVLALGSFLRLYKLGELSVWPMWDEGHHAFFAIELAEKWHWQFFFSSAQYMPVYTWFQGLFFKAVPPSLFSMWLYPALYSLFLPPLAYGLARQVLSPSLAFLYSALLSLSFWPLFIANFANDIGPCLIWGNIVFFLWFRLRRSLEKADGRALGWAVALGLATGIGWYISKFWLSSIPVLTLAVLSLKGREKRPTLPWLPAFLVSMAVPLAPMAFLILTGRYGSHIQAYLTLDAPHVTWQNHLLGSLSYPTSLFWGSLDKSHFFFGPLWGGFLNPIVGAAFFIGLLEVWRRRRDLGLTWIFPALLIFLAQGMSSNYLEDIRITPMMPMMSLIAAFGIQRFLQSFSMGKRWMLLGMLLALSLGTDLYHLWGPYHRWAIPSKESGLSKPPEQFRAYPVLEAQSRRDGPGLILTDLVRNDFNQTLLVATYPFNAARNPALDPAGARWVGLVTDEGLGHFLQPRFPGAQQVPLSQGLGRYFEGLDLWLIPIDPKDRGTFLAWARANRFLQDLYPDIPCDVAQPDYGEPIKELLANQGLFQEDDFLRLIFWGKLADQAWGQFYWRHQERDLFLETARELVRAGQENGRLYYRIGMAEVSAGDYAEAEKCLVKAGQLDPDYQPPADKLVLLERLQKEKKGLSKGKRIGPP